MVFPVSGVEVNPLIPPLYRPGGLNFHLNGRGVRGLSAAAFSGKHPQLHQPVGFSHQPGFNIVAIPSGVYRYIREGRMNWPVTWVVILGTLPGIFVGAFIRVNWMLDPKNFKLFVGCVLLYIGLRLLYEQTPRAKAKRARSWSSRPGSRSA